MKRFTKILESLSERVTIDSELEDLQNDLISMVEESTNTDDVNLQMETITSYIEDNNTTIIGLVNDSDIFDFYLKHRNQLDMVLTDINHFDTVPSKMGVNNSIYEYLVESTKIGIQETLKRMTNNED